MKSGGVALEITGHLVTPLSSEDAHRVSYSSMCFEHMYVVSFCSVHGSLYNICLALICELPAR